MKYIKLFEIILTVEEQFYWQVNTKQPYFRFALKKIGMKPKDIEYWNHFFIEEDYEVFIFKTIYDDGDIVWTWSELSEDTTEGCIFMGKVEVGDWEIEADRYNL